VNGVRAVERLVSRILLWGGLLSVGLVLAGLVIYTVEGQPHAREIVRVVHNREAGRAVDVFTSLADVRRALAQRPPEPLAITALGLVALLATPVVGVAAAIPAFWHAGDRSYAAIAAVVLAMLLFSFALAGGA
jgi:uncharacterized membrane protein